MIDALILLFAGYGVARLCIDLVDLLWPVR